MEARFKEQPSMQVSAGAAATLKSDFSFWDVVICVLVVFVAFGVLGLVIPDKPTYKADSSEAFPVNKPSYGARGFNTPIVNTDATSEDDDHQQELANIKQELRRRQFSSNPADKNLSDIRRRLEPLEELARARSAKINRKPWQQGYTLEQRRAAAYLAFLKLGYSETEARLTVDAMDRQGRLPDPPRE